MLQKLQLLSNWRRHSNEQIWSQITETAEITKINDDIQMSKSEQVHQKMQKLSKSMTIFKWANLNPGNKKLQKLPTKIVDDIQMSKSEPR